MKPTFLTYVFVAGSLLFSAMSFFWHNQPQVSMLYIIGAIGLVGLSLIEQVIVVMQDQPKGPQQHKLNLSDEVSTKDGQ